MHQKKLTLLRPQKLLRFPWLFDPLTLFGWFSKQYSLTLAGKEIPLSNEDRISPIDRVDSHVGNTLGLSFSTNEFSWFVFIEPFPLYWSWELLVDSTFCTKAWTSLEDSASESSAANTWNLAKKLVLINKTEQNEPAKKKLSYMVNNMRKPNQDKITITSKAYDHITRKDKGTWSAANLSI